MVACKPITPAQITSLCATSLHNAKLTASKKHAAARGILRYGQHLADNSATRKPGGLNPGFLDLHALNAEVNPDELRAVIQECQNDMFDSITAMDVVDGGISILLRCPGFIPSPNMTSDKLTVDLFVSPREVAEGGKELSKHLALLVQAFGVDIALPYLQRFSDRCGKEDVNAPKAPANGKYLIVDGPSHLPQAKLEGYFRCRCQPGRASALAQKMAFAEMLANHQNVPLEPSVNASVPLDVSIPMDTFSETNTTAPLEPSVNTLVPLNTSIPMSTQPMQHSDTICETDTDDEKYWSHVDSFDDFDDTLQNLNTTPEVMKISLEDTASAFLFNFDPNSCRPSTADGFEGTIVSIGPATDALLDQYGLPDSLIPRLRVLTQNVRNTAWEGVLRRKGSQFNIDSKLARKISKALHHDLRLPDNVSIFVDQYVTELTKDAYIVFERPKPKDFSLVKFDSLMSDLNILFYDTGPKSVSSVQSKRQRVPRPQLSVAAHEAIIAKRRNASKEYNAALEEAWGTIDETAVNIAATHHKSIRHVQSELHMGRQLAYVKRKKTSVWNAFCWKKSLQNKENLNDDASNTNNASGKEILQHLVKDHHDEYNALTPEESRILLREFEAVKATKAKGRRISMKSKINDVTQTLTAVENELHNLKSRTGVETMLFSTRGTTDLSMKGISFATSGVENFLEGTMKTDTQDFLGKMEGFAVAGVRGAAQNHKQRISQIRGDIRNLINVKLREITQVSDAKMEWKHYWRNVVKRYLVVIEGWPPGIPFENLSSVSSSLTALEDLLRKWRCGTTYWKALSESEFNDLDTARDRQIEDGDITPPAPRRRRSDCGKKRSRMISDEDQLRAHKARKITSPEEVRESDDEDGICENEESGSAAE
ncbi:hypothetical protein C0992_001988 [Termitomyces sp. T32_za158]|nr:hypothetical protein C0992_001988 [Termitomyces sp. T32_za158]